MAKNVTSLTLETLQTLDGTENVVMFDSAEGKRATLTTLSDYALKKHRSSGMDETIYDQGESLKQEITELKAAVGSPLVANTASEMTDQTKIYVYTGTETGYSQGHWYYWNGSAWTDGGVYQATAVETDKTLTLSDKPADSKTVGDTLATKATHTQVYTKISENIDSTLSVSGKSADAKATGDSLKEKASASGMVDMAKSLVGGKYTADKQPYHFRCSPSGGAKDEVIVGGSLGWNQLVQNGNFESASGWTASFSSLSVSNNEATLVSDKTNLVGSEMYRTDMNFSANRVCVVSCMVKTSNTPYFRVRYPVQSQDVSLSNDGKYHPYTIIVKTGTSGLNGFGLQAIKSNASDESTVSYKGIKTFDLTACFGSTIADYIYSLEQSSAGAGLAWVKRYIDLDTYHEYDAGSIQSVEGLVSHDVVGFNQWDEETALGYYDPANNGAFVSNSGWTACKNYIPCLPNTDYYMKIGVPSSGSFGAFLFYDGDKNYISYFSSGGVANKTFTTPSNCHYMTFYANKTWFAENICINLSDPAKNGTYEPYEKHSYPLDSSVTLRGVPKLVTDHIEFDGDRYRADGQVERRYGIVVLDGTQSNFSVSAVNDFAQVSWNGYNNIGVSKAVFVSDKFVYADSASGAEGRIYPSNSASRMFLGLPSTVTTAAQAQAWFASNPTTVIYPLATPTSETVQPFQSPMLVGQTEEYVSESVVPVGHDSRYYEDITGKVNNLPSDFSTLIAPVEKTFTATRNYAVGSYLIVNNQLYKVTSAISSGGTITPNSNCTATTIMAEILALA